MLCHTLGIAEASNVQSCRSVDRFYDHLFVNQMERIPETEEIRQQLQESHCSHIRIHSSLAATLLNLSQAQYRIGETAAGYKSLLRAEQAVGIARKGLDHIKSPEERAILEALVSETEALVRKALG